MPISDLGIRQRAAMFALMAEAREVSNPELEQLAGFRLTGPQRLTLNDRGLVSSRRVGRAYLHELTDKGWRWCADELAGPVPRRAGSAGGALYAVLSGLHRYLERSGLALADLFRATPPSAPPQRTGDRSAPDQLVATADPAGEAVESVRAAYRRLARGPRDWVRVAHLRDELAALPRQQVDDALRSLSRERVANLVPQANQHDLTPADRAAAVRVGADDCHLISIEERW